MNLVHEIMKCRVCDHTLPLGAKPVVQVSPVAKILISGQAPSLQVHRSGKLFNDKSGHTLRSWLGANEIQFYDTNIFSIVPMAFCYPGKGKSGDLPPPKVCAETWQAALKPLFKDIELHIIVGQYAQRYFCENFNSVTELVSNWQIMLPRRRIALPHPSPRNQPWLAKNPWFENELLPDLRLHVEKLIAS